MARHIQLGVVAIKLLPASADRLGAVSNEGKRQAVAASNILQPIDFIHRDGRLSGHAVCQGDNLETRLGRNGPLAWMRCMPFLDAERPGLRALGRRCTSGCKALNTVTKVASGSLISVSRWLWVRESSHPHRHPRTAAG